MSCTTARTTKTNQQPCRKQCMLLGKRANNAMSVSFSHIRTHKIQDVNLQWKRVWWPEGNSFVSVPPSYRPGLFSVACAIPAAGPCGFEVYSHLAALFGYALSLHQRAARWRRFMPLCRHLPMCRYMVHGALCSVFSLAQGFS